MAQYYVGDAYSKFEQYFSSSLYYGDKMKVCSGSISDVTMHGGELWLLRRSEAHNIVVSGGIVYLSYYGYISSFQDVPTISGMILKQGGALKQDGDDGTVVSDLTVDGGRVDLSGSSNLFYNVTITANGTFWLEDGYVNNVDLKSGHLKLSNATAKGITLYAGGSLVVYKSEITNLSWTPCAGELIVNDWASWENISFKKQPAGVYFGTNHKQEAYAATMSNKTVGSGKIMYVTKNGKAVNTTIQNGGTVQIITGGVMSNTTVKGSAELISGTMSNTTLSDNGRLTIFSGVVDSLKCAKGTTYISDNNNGIRKATVMSGAVVTLYGNAVNWTIQNNGHLKLGSSAVITNAVLEKGAAVSFADKNAIASNTKINGATIIAAAGSFQNTQINAGGTLIKRNTLAHVSGTTINKKGSMIVSTGTVLDTVINSSGALHVYSGATASQTTVKQSGYLGIGNGGCAYSTVLDYAGKLTVWNGGTVIGNTINKYGTIILSKGAAANSSYIHDKGGLHVYSGATAENTTVYQGGYFGVGKGATTYNTTLAQAGKLTVWGGGVVHDNTINKWGTLTLSSGALAKSSFIYSQGGLHVYSGAVASSTTVYQGGYFGVGKGAKTFYTTIASGGKLTVWGGGVITHSVINSQGAIILSSGALASGTQVVSGGGLHIYSGAVASDTTINYGASLGVGKGGILKDGEVAADASLKLYDGAILKGEIMVNGKITTANNINVKEAEICFSITRRSDKDGAFVNSINPIANAKSLYLEVNASQRHGQYLIADSAAGFRKEIAIVINGRKRGYVSMGKSFSYMDNKYTLIMLDNQLELKVSEAPSDVNITDAPLDSFSSDEMLLASGNDTPFSGFIA